jgi:hypothetical protein
MPDAGVPAAPSDEQALRNEIVGLAKLVNALMNRAERGAAELKPLEMAKMV